MRAKTSLGVDISGEKINMVLLKQTKDGVKLLKSASGPVPAGAISDGSVKDPMALAKAIRVLKNRERIGPRRTVASCLPCNMLTQVMELPKDLPSNIGQYVQKEVRQCAMFPTRNMALGYCGLTSSHKSGVKRVLVAATENDRMCGLAKALTEAGLDVEVIEPAELAAARAIYAKKILHNLDQNVLIALVENDSVTLSVFRKQNLDFVRRRDIDDGFCNSQQGLDRFAEEIGAIIQYYDIEFGDNSQKWQLVTVLHQAGDDTETVLNFLQKKFSGINIEVLSEQSGCECTPVATNKGAENASLVAIGLAMKLLDLPKPKLEINLVPPESCEVTAVKKEVLITATVTVGILALMILTVAFLTTRLFNNHRLVRDVAARAPLASTNTLLIEQEKTYETARNLFQKLQETSEALRLARIADWHLILDDIRQRTPKSLWITSLVGEEDLRMVIKGQSVSYEAVNIFIDMLGESKYINSADLVEAEKDRSARGVVSYRIDCSLTTFEGT